MGKETVNQHYVPQFVLKYYCDKERTDKAWELNLRTNKICLKNIEKLCAKNNLYEIRDDNGKFLFPEGRNKLEKGLAKIEADYAGFFDELFFQVPKKAAQFVIDEDDRQSLCTWATIIILRNPLMKHLYPEVSKEVLKIKIESEKDKAYNFVDLMRILFLPLAEKLLARKLQFLVTDETNPFVMTDIPFYIFPNEFPNNTFFPLSSRIAIQYKEKLLPFENPNHCIVKALEPNAVWEWNMNMYYGMRGALQSNIPMGMSVIASKKNTLEDLLYSL